MRLHRTFLALVVQVLATASMAGCHRDDTSRASRDLPEKAVSVAAHGREAPRMKATRAPEQSRLGALPPGVGIAVGEPVPDVTVHDGEGRAVRLRDLWDDGPILLVFYRGGWCPFCNFQIREMTTAFPDFQGRGVTPVAVSVDRMEESARTSATYEIPFPVLSDPDLAAHRAFRVVHRVDDAELERLKGFGMDIERASGREHHVIAIPSLFAIDRQGIVRWAHADADYRVRPTTRQVIDALVAEMTNRSISGRRSSGSPSARRRRFSR